MEDFTSGCLNGFLTVESSVLVNLFLMYFLAPVASDLL